MLKKTLVLLIFLSGSFLWAQSPTLDSLTVEKIMRDPLWIGTSPSEVFWSPNSEKLYFKWNPEKALSDSLYVITPRNHQPQKVSDQQRALVLAQRHGTRSEDGEKIVFKKGKHILMRTISSGKLTPVVTSTAQLANPRFGLHDKVVVYRKGRNLFTWTIATGTTTQVTNFKTGQAPQPDTSTAQAEALKKNALANSAVLRQRKHKKEMREANASASEVLPPVYIGEASVTSMSLSPDGKTVMYRLSTFPDAKHTIVPNYVTQSGYTTDINSRTVVGVTQPTFASYIYYREKDTVINIDTEQIPGIHDIPAYFKNDYPKRYATLKKDPPLRSVRLSAPIWNADGSAAFVVIRSLDHKDRWLMQIDMSSAKLTPINRQHDDAWIAGPGIGYTYSTGNVGWIDANTIWFQSSASGYSHLYTQDLKADKATALTSGEFEIQEATLSPDHESFYVISNKLDPAQNQFYHLNIDRKELTRVTHRVGGFKATVSPDGKRVALLYSTSTTPWELYLKRNRTRGNAEQITHKAASEEYLSYDWRKPEFITFTDRDGFEVHAQVFKPEHQAASRPGVIFVHGAGYLQDVLKSWGHYFREHMFINLLLDHGYTVMNIDYRGSAGYGRDWRTAIYRHMGGNDLEDIVDGAKYMRQQLNVNPENIGLWGGSYGGFMTLSALFKTDVFKSGGALRSVTDWAHYNHGYTSNILNNPQDDPLAYKRSSPIYFAKGKQHNEHLLMCHGMVDINVHFQDIVRLTQKLIELGKENWELAVYPVESHGFVEPSSWTDEYRRIFKLFEETLK